MKKSFSKFLFTCTVATMIVGFMPNITYAAEYTLGRDVIHSESEISARAEVRGYILRVVDGVTQKRLWSYTRGVWLEPGWTNL